MNTRFIVQFNGWYENGTQTPKQFLILNIEGDVSMAVINSEIERLGGLSPYRRNKEIFIHLLQAF